MRSKVCNNISCSTICTAFAHRAATIIGIFPRKWHRGRATRQFQHKSTLAAPAAKTTCTPSPSLSLPLSLSLSLALAGFHLAKAFVLASEPAADVECADGVCTVKLASTFPLEWQRKVLCASRRRRRRRRQRRIVLQRRMKVCNIKFLLSNK